MPAPSNNRTNDFETRLSACVRDLCSAHEALLLKYRETCKQNNQFRKLCGDSTQVPSYIHSDLCVGNAISDIPEIPEIPVPDNLEHVEGPDFPNYAEMRPGSRGTPAFAAQAATISRFSYEASMMSSMESIPERPPPRQRRQSFFMARQSVVADNFERPSVTAARKSLRASAMSDLRPVRPCSTQIVKPTMEDLPSVVKDFECRSVGSGQSKRSIERISKMNNDTPVQVSNETTLEKIWDFLDKPLGTTPRRVFHQLFKICLVASVISPIIATTNISKSVREELVKVDLFFTVLFTVQIVVKAISCPNKVAFVRNIYTLLDTIVIVAGYINVATVSELNSALHIVANQFLILRLLEITRQSDGWPLLWLAVKRCVAALRIPLYLMLVIVVFAGSFHYWIDKGMGCTEPCDPSLLPAFDSIPHAMWYVIVTVATVGYGDVYPHTYLGKCLASVEILFGVCYMAMPLAIIGNNFSQVWEDRHRLLVRQRLLERLQYISLEEVEALFSQIDTDKDGTIDLNEFITFISSLKLDVAKRDAIDLYRAIDVDGSDSMSFEEFIDFVLEEGEELVEKFRPTTAS